MAAETEKIPKFEVWKTIKLSGTEFKTGEDFRQDLNRIECQIDYWTNDILKKIVFPAVGEDIEIDFVRITPVLLGFQDCVSLGRIYDGAQKTGFGLCSVQAALQLRIEYQDQLDGDHVLIGMEFIYDSKQNSRFFVVGRDGSGLRLDAYRNIHSALWEPNISLAFVLPRK